MWNVEIGCVHITWRGEPLEKALADIAAAGYAGAMASPRPGTPHAEVLALYAQHGLKPAPGYMSAEFWKAEKEAEILEQARLYAAFGKAAGVTELFVAANGFADYTTARGLNRAQVAGHVQPEDAMTDAEYAQFAQTLNHVAEILLEEDVHACFHNHVGSMIETGAEIERLLSLVDPALVFLGPDTGHLEWGGVDSVEFCRTHAASIKTIHLKDVNRAVLEEGVAARWDYGQFSDQGIWAEPGRGDIDFPAIFRSLEDAGFSGWIFVEVDVTQLPTPLESAVVSRQYLKSLGL